MSAIFNVVACLIGVGVFCLAMYIHFIDSCFAHVRLSGNKENVDDNSGFFGLDVDVVLSGVFGLAIAFIAIIGCVVIHRARRWRWRERNLISKNDSRGALLGQDVTRRPGPCLECLQRCGGCLGVMYFLLLILATFAELVVVIFVLDLCGYLDAVDFLHPVIDHLGRPVSAITRSYEAVLNKTYIECCQGAVTNTSNCLCAWMEDVPTERGELCLTTTSMFDAFWQFFRARIIPFWVVGGWLVLWQSACIISHCRRSCCCRCRAASSKAHKRRGENGANYQSVSHNPHRNEHNVSIGMERSRQVKFASDAKEQVMAVPVVVPASRAKLQAPLPSGWIECWSADKKKYYQNNLEKITQWERPT